MSVLKYEKQIKDCVPIKVSGGTAAMYLVQCDTDILNENEKYPFLGKEYSRALDELDFQDNVLKVRTKPEYQVFHYCMDYLGVRQLEYTDEKNSTKQVDLLILNNLKWRCKNFRFIDIKIGEQTAASNWQGKSRLECYPNWIVDSLSNSMQEYQRLEGFDGEPDNLAQWFGSKKLTRIMLQRFKTRLFLQQLFDYQRVESWGEIDQLYQSSQVQEFKLPIEQIESELLIMIMQLIEINKGLQILPVPMKLIGSSIGVVFDNICLDKIPRFKFKESSNVWEMNKPDLRKKRIQIFDWGRSKFELESLDEKIEDYKDRNTFFNQYTKGVQRYLFENLKYQVNRFQFDQDQFENVQLNMRVRDKDLQQNETDYIAKVDIKPFQLERDKNMFKNTFNVMFTLNPTNKELVFDKQLMNKDFQYESTIECKFQLKIEFYQLSMVNGSKFEQITRLQFDRISNLKSQQFGTVDLFIDQELIAQEKKKEHLIGQYHTHYIQNDNNPKWGEEYTFGKLKKPYMSDFLFEFNNISPLTSINIDQIQELFHSMHNNQDEFIKFESMTNSRILRNTD